MQVLDIAVIEEPAAAEASLDPIRARILAALAEPGSADHAGGAAWACRGRRSTTTSRSSSGTAWSSSPRSDARATSPSGSTRATAASYVISPQALAAVSPDPDRAPDQLSARWLLALGARLVQEVGTLLTGAARARQRVATFGLDAEVRFASAADRAAFADELAQSVAALVSRYHDEARPAAATHRLVVGAAPDPDAPGHRPRAEPAPIRRSRRLRRRTGGPDDDAPVRDRASRSRCRPPPSRSGRRSPPAPGSTPGSWAATRSSRARAERRHGDRRPAAEATVTAYEPGKRFAAADPAPRTAGSWPSST